MKNIIIFLIVSVFFQQTYAESVLDIAASGDVEKMSQMLEQGTHPGTMDIMGFALIHEAAKSGHVNMVKLLQEKGVDIFAETDDGLNALHIAAAEGRLRMADYLLEQGLDPSQKDGSRGLTPLQWALDFGHLSTAVALLEGGADINDVDKHGWTALHHERFFWRLAGVRFLTDRGADVSAENLSGSTPSDLAEISRVLYDSEYETSQENPAQEVEEQEEVKEKTQKEENLGDPPLVYNEDKGEKKKNKEKDKLKHRVDNDEKEATFFEKLASKIKKHRDGDEERSFFENVEELGMIAGYSYLSLAFFIDCEVRTTTGIATDAGVIKRFLWYERCELNKDDCELQQNMLVKEVQDTELDIRSTCRSVFGL